MKMTELLKDPTYRKYYLKAPRFPYPIASEKPWTVWIRKPRPNGKMTWARVKFATFKEAFNYCKPRMADWDDFSITSMVIGFVPPTSLRNAYELNEWCYRCRRPVEMRAFARHHALKPEIHEYFADWPVCPFCGASEEAQFTLVPG